VWLLLVVVGVILFALGIVGAVSQMPDAVPVPVPIESPPPL